MIINSNTTNQGLNNDESDLQTQINDLSNKVDDNSAAITTLQNKDISDATSITTGTLTATTENVTTSNITTANITTQNITNENVVGTDASFTNLTADNITLGAGESKLTSFALNIPYSADGTTMFAIKDSASVVCYIKTSTGTSLQSFNMNGKVLSINSDSKPFIKAGYDSTTGLAYITMANTILSDGCVLTVLNMENLDTDVVQITQNGTIPETQDWLTLTNIASQVINCQDTYVAQTLTSKSGAEKTGSINCNSVTQSGDVSGNNLVQTTGISTAGTISGNEITQSTSVVQPTIVGTGQIAGQQGTITGTLAVGSLISSTANPIGITAKTQFTGDQSFVNISATGNATLTNLSASGDQSFINITSTGNATLAQTTQTNLSATGDLGGKLLPFIGQILTTDGTNPGTVYTNTTWELIKQE